MDHIYRLGTALHSHSETALNISSLLENPEGRQVLVLGAGKSGLAATKCLARLGFSVHLLDQSPGVTVPKNGNATLHTLANSQTVEALLSKKTAFAILSPGFSEDNELVSTLKTHSVPLCSEIDLGIQLAGQPLVAVTGTNGKTTVCQLLSRMLEVPATGNIGKPLTEFSGGDYVLELSSYQLEQSELIRPRVALWLNQSEDHLARHGTMDAYVRAKGRIFRNQTDSDYSVLNADEEYFAAISRFARGKTVLFGQQQRNARIEQGRLWFDFENQSSSFVLSSWKLLGKHNELNALAALCAAKLLGADDEHLQQVINTFAPPEHRLEPVGTHAGVLYINDSKATNVTATTVALEAIREQVLNSGGVLHLILGGQSKGEALEPLVTRLSSFPKVRIYTFGRDAKRFSSALSAFTCEEHQHLLPIIQSVSKEAFSGDTVLFAPACASFDQFANFEARGAAFKSAVESVVAEGVLLGM